MDFPYDKLSLTIALAIAVIALWRFAIAGLKRRDEDREQVLRAYEASSAKAEAFTAKLEALVHENNNTINRLTDTLDDIKETLSRRKT